MFQVNRSIIDCFQKNSLNVCFPNVDRALRIYLSIMVTNCIAERFFQKLREAKMNAGPSWANKGLNPDVETVVKLSFSNQHRKPVNV